MSDDQQHALALILKARGTAQSIGLKVAYQHYKDRTLQILMRGPYAVLKQSSAKSAFEELLSLSETAAFLPRKENLEIILHFDLRSLDHLSAEEC